MKDGGLAGGEGGATGKVVCFAVKDDGLASKVGDSAGKVEGLAEND